MDELKPCPFCGVVPELAYDWSNEPYVACVEDDCDMSVSTATKPDAESAIAAWNHRATTGEPERKSQ